MAEKPTSAFVLSLIGGIFYLLVGVLVAIASAFIGTIGMAVGAGIAGLAVATVGIIGLVCGIIMVIGAAMMNSSEKSRVRTGAILVLIFSLIGGVFTFGGIVIGFVLALVGSILGLVWKPSATTPPPPMPPS